MLKLIALDLDGTLLNDNKVISKYTNEILNRYIDAGVHIAVASGRAFDSLPKEILDIPGVEYAITSNGVAICRHSTGDMLFHQMMSEQSVRGIMEIAEQNDCNFEVFIDGVAYAKKEYVENPVAFGSPERAVPYVQKTRTPTENLHEFVEQNINRIDCIDFIIPSDDSIKKDLESKVAKVEGIYITSSVPNLIEISHENAGKGAALERLAEHLGVERTEVAAFGNAENDIDMMKYAGYGVAVANSPMDVKIYADYITLSNNDDGVAVFLEQLLSYIK